MTTARGLYEAVLIELNKENAPNILLEQFNYYANKAINQYINKRYNIYDINQQTTDDLRVLKATALLPVAKVNEYNDLSLANQATYECILPSDYLHILNCICVYNVLKTYKCYNSGDTWRFPAKRLTADAYSMVLDNFWNKPDYKRPYYYIHNVNTSTKNPTNPYDESTGKGTDIVTRKNISNEDKTKLSNSWTFENVNIDEVTYKFPYLKPNSQNSWLPKSIVEDDREGNRLYLLIDDNWNFYTKWLDPGDIGSSTINGNNNVISFSPTTKIIELCQDLGDIARDISFSAITALKNEGTNTSLYLDGNTIKATSMLKTDAHGNTIIQADGIPSSIDIANIKSSNVERAAGVRYGNKSLVRLEIRYGTDDSVFKLKNVYIDYIKAPQYIRLTQEQIDWTEDRSQMLEFPDYVCQEIINELVTLILENIGDLRLLTHPIVNLSIANPAQQLAQPQQQ